MMIEKFEAVTSAALPAIDLPNVDALLKDFATVNNGTAPLTFGLFRISRGEAVPYAYEFDEYKLVLEGEVTVTDEAGAIRNFKAGDVIQFSKGAKVKFSSASTGLTFYVAQR